MQKVSISIANAFYTRHQNLNKRIDVQCHSCQLKQKPSIVENTYDVQTDMNPNIT